LRVGEDSPKWCHVRWLKREEEEVEEGFGPAKAL
jgi:hypothetical protein